MSKQPSKDTELEVGRIIMTHTSEKGLSNKVIPDLVALIERYTAEARIDELKRLSIYPAHTVKLKEYLDFRIEQLTNQEGRK